MSIAIRTTFLRTTVTRNTSFDRFLAGDNRVATFWSTTE